MVNAGMSHRPLKGKISILGTEALNDSVDGSVKHEVKTGEVGRPVRLWQVVRDTYVFWKEVSYFCNSKTPNSSSNDT